MSGVIQEGSRIGVESQQQRIHNRRNEGNGDCWDLLAKIAKVAIPFFISFAAFALLTPAEAVVVTVLVVVASLFYLFRNVAPSQASVDRFFYPSYSYAPRAASLRGAEYTPRFSANNGEIMSGQVRFGSSEGKAATPTQAPGPTRATQEGKAATPSASTYQPHSHGGMGHGRSSLGSAPAQTGFGSGPPVPTPSTTTHTSHHNVGLGNSSFTRAPQQTGFGSGAPTSSSSSSSSTTTVFTATTATHTGHHNVGLGNSSFTSAPAQTGFGSGHPSSSSSSSSSTSTASTVSKGQTAFGSGKPKP